jgi:hypothetical protein
MTASKAHAPAELRAKQREQRSRFSVDLSC